MSSVNDIVREKRVIEVRMTDADTTRVYFQRFKTTCKLPMGISLLH